MQGYWKDAEATAKALDRNGYHTGDLGYRDEEGYFYVIGRKDNLLKVGGHRINPQEIEDAFMETGLLTETIVLGIPDDLLGHKLIAVGVAKNGDVTIPRMLSECAKRLPKHKLPHDVKLVRALPKNSSGKIDRTKCCEIAKSVKP
jgi:acyl-coenzyme A synthetase/AMP-(fatty) acid ligase